MRNGATFENNISVRKAWRRRQTILLALERAVFRDLNGSSDRAKAGDHIASAAAKVCDGQAPPTSKKRLG
jgi:hypothetical protein